MKEKSLVKNKTDVVKILAYIFIPLGTIVSLFFTYYNFKETIGYVIGLIIMIATMLLSISIMIAGILSLVNQNKSIVLGVFLIICCSFLGGIFYLTWRNKTPSVDPDSSSSSLSWFCPKCGKKNYFKEECECGYIKKKDYIDNNNNNNKSYSICRKCNHINDKDAIYCVRCGEPIKADSKKGL